MGRARWSRPGRRRARGMAGAATQADCRHRAAIMNPVVLGCAYAMDVIVGDPEWLPHPVRAMGRMIAAAESVARPGRHPPVRDLLNGALVTVVVVVTSAAGAVAALRAARQLHPGLGLITEALLGWTVLATGSLLTEAVDVIHALEEGDIVSARARLARIV